MLEFPKEYFREEEREGFVIEEAMKRAWAAQIEVLQQVGGLCEKHGLTYQACFGTLLGAVRHRGFIPWDDDIDIVMPRRDYIKLMEVAPQELPAGYRVLSIYTENEWHEMNFRIMNSDAIDTSDKRLREYHGCPFAVGIDIFALDALPDKADVLELQIGMLDLIGNLNRMLVESQKLGKEGAARAGYDRTLHEGLTALEKYYDMRFVRNHTLRNQLYRLYDKICMMYGRESDVYRVVYPAYFKSKRSIKWEKQWLEKTVLSDFENIRVPVPEDSDACLRATYGDNYMVPIKGTAVHDYPFYREQKEMLEERGIWEDVMQRARMI